MNGNKIFMVNDPELLKLAMMIRKSMEPRVKAIAEELSKAKWPDELLKKI
ncbi:MAG: hypothetical protein JWP12_875 [Bacteroidetes bacterium]|nr:hypothetical protein [Bacteroidota bacterium]